MNDKESAAAKRVKMGLAITTLGGLLFTLDLPLLRLSLADQWTMVCARGLFLFASITCLWFVLRRTPGKSIPYVAGAAGLAVALTNTISNIAYIGAITETNAANVVFIIALVPVLTAAMSNIFLKEKVHAFTWTVIAIASLGVAIIVWDGIGTGRWLGDLMALASAACTAIAFTIIRATGKSVVTSFAIGSLASAVIAGLFFNVDLASLTAAGAFGVTAWHWIALNGLVAIPLATVFMANGPRFLPSTDVSMFYLLETTLTPLWIWYLFGERPTNAALTGGSLVVLTLLAHSWWRYKSSLRLAPAE